MTQEASRGGRASLSPRGAGVVLIGVLLALWGGSRPWPMVATAAALPVMAWIAWRWRALRWAALALLGALWAMLHAGLSLHARLPIAWEGRQVEVVGTIVDLPVVEPRRTRFLLRIDDEPSQPAPLRGREVQVGWYDEFRASEPGPRSAIRAGTRWRMWLRVRAPRGLRNPGGFDAERQAVAHRLAARAVVRRPHAARELAPPAGLVAWRARMSAHIAAEVPGPGARYVQALALGDTRGLGDDDWRLLRADGLTHLIAISGFHVGLAGLFGAWLAQLLWRWSGTLAAWLPRPQAVAWASLGAAAIYACVAGLSLPTVRTVLMIAVAVFARLRRRAVSPLQMLALALLAVLVVDPLSVLSAGFWLSFGGVAWLVLAMPRNGSGQIVEFLRAQWVATLGLLPLGVWLFGQVSWIGPIANLVAVPWWSLVVVPLSLLALGLETLHEGACGFLWRLAAGAFELAWPLFQWLAERSFAVAWLPEPGALDVALALLAALAWLLPRGTPGKVLASVLWVPLFWPDLRRPPHGEVELLAFDVGQGLAVLVRTGNHALLYDTAPKVADGFDAGERVVVPGLRAVGVTVLDRVVVSHADDDHAGGLQAVRAEVPVGRLQAPPEAPLPAPAEACLAGEQWQWDGVKFRFLHPPPRFPYFGNESSCVLRIETAGGAVLLTGDIGRVIEQRLLGRGRANLKADVVFAPHHGSAGSSTPGFVRATGARLVVFSSGYGNRFGHPRGAVVRRWRQAGAESLDTAGSGAVRIWLGPAGLRVREQRRWQLRWWDAAVRPRPAVILPGSKQSADVPEG